ncbi:MAG: endonuclease domain-containing protein [Acetobacteraceae bacterium]|nr:endonuclease domain-containing protein [Acetobacteraceae bacterium]
MPSSHENDSPSPCGRGPGVGVEQRKRLFRFAREMRHESTRAEQLLWYRLRGKRLNGLKFRRQVPMGPYIADFFCPSMRLVIEVDGASHFDSRTDGRRDAWMRSQELRVLRVWNDEVVSNLEGVLQATAVVASCATGEAFDAATPPPGPLPQGEGEK